MRAASCFKMVWRREFQGPKAVTLRLSGLVARDGNAIDLNHSFNSCSDIWASLACDISCHVRVLANVISGVTSSVNEGTQPVTTLAVANTDNKRTKVDLGETGLSVKHKARITLDP